MDFMTILQEAASLIIVAFTLLNKTSSTTGPYVLHKYLVDSCSVPLAIKESAFPKKGIGIGPGNFRSRMCRAKFHEFRSSTASRASATAEVIDASSVSFNKPDRRYKRAACTMVRAVRGIRARVSRLILLRDNGSDVFL
jgi:hypothetical protein